MPLEMAQLPEKYRVLSPHTELGMAGLPVKNVQLRHKHGQIVKTQSRTTIATLLPITPPTPDVKVR